MLDLTLDLVRVIGLRIIRSLRVLSVDNSTIDLRTIPDSTVEFYSTSWWQIAILYSLNTALLPQF